MQRSLMVQTALIVIVGLTIAYLVSLMLYSRDRFQALIDLSLQRSAQTISHINHTIAVAAPKERSRLVASFNAPWISVSVYGKSSVSKDGSVNSLERDFLSYIESQRHGAESSHMRVRLSEELPKGIQLLHEDSLVDVVFHGVRRVYGLPAHLTLIASTRMPDGKWLNISMFASELPAKLWSPSLLTVAMMTITIVFVSVFAVRRMLQPMREFAGAAQRFARNIDTPPLPEKGPVELREVARAFGEMQSQIRRLVRHRTEMMASISHDIRTPITLLRLRTESLPESAEREKMLETLGTLEDTVTSSLTFAREIANIENRKKVDIGTLVQALCDDLSESGMSVKFIENNEEFLVSGQPNALKRAFSNLLDNGLKYGRAVKATMSVAGDKVSVHIDDDGPGIADSDIGRVFEPFFRVDHSRNDASDGTGLGLSIARAVVENHGGAINLFNRPEGGLRVTVNLPRVLAASKGGANTPSSRD